MRRLIACAVALGLVGCQTPPAAAPTGPSGAMGAIAKQAADLVAASDIQDAPFENFLTDLDLKKTYGARADEIADQLRKSRQKAITAPRSASAVGGRLASRSASIGVFIVPEFAQTLADSLDPFTRQSGTQELKPKPYVSAEDGPTASTTTSLNITSVLSSTGPRVTLTMHWTFHSTSKDKASGAALVDMTDERTMVGAITVCPDADGQVGATIDVHSQFANAAGGVTTNYTTTSDSVFTGHVDDSAALRSVNQVLQDKQSWEASSGNGSYDAIVATSYTANNDGFMSGFNAGDFTGSFNASDPATGDRIGKLAAWSLVLDAYAFDGAYKSAQKLWRNGRCVMLTAPGYGAETPIAVADQQKSQHDEEVDAGSKTQFAVGLKHRFGSALSQPVAAALASGAKTLTPDKLDAVPGSLTYEAPDEPDKQATAQLKSTSKRGIGTLVLAFHTVSEKFTLTISGTMLGTTALPPLGGFTVSDTITVGPAEFAKLTTAGGTTLFEAKGAPWQVQTRTDATFYFGAESCSASEKGSLGLVAYTEVRAGKKLVVVDQVTTVTTAGAGTKTGSDTCLSWAHQGGDLAALFIAMLGNIVVPTTGEHVALHGTSSDPTGGLTADATAFVITKK